MRDFYKILGIEQSASQEDIKKAYRKLSLKFHPDVNQGDMFFENLFQQIQEAYETLSNPNTRHIYDKELKESTNKLDNSNQTNYSNFEPVIEFFFTNNTTFYSGDEIKFSWKVYNADFIELRPFSSIPSYGDKIIKLNNFNQQYFSIELIATNTYINKSISRIIILENQVFVDAREQLRQNNNIVNDVSTNIINTDSNKFWNVNGRINNNQYLIRVVVYIIGMFFFESLFSVYPIFIYNIYDLYHMMLYHISMLIIFLILKDSIKRGNDLNISVWFNIVLFIPFFNILYILFLIFVPGTKDENKHGPQP